MQLFSSVYNNEGSWDLRINQNQTNKKVEEGYNHRDYFSDNYGSHIVNIMY